MKDKVTIKSNILIALIYFLGAIGIVPGLLMAGYALIVQKDEDAKTPAYITIGTTVVMFFLSTFIFTPIIRYTDSQGTVETLADLIFWINLLVSLVLAIFGVLSLCGVKVDFKAQTSSDQSPVIKEDAKPVKTISQDMGTAEKESIEVEKVNGEDKIGD